MRTEQEMYTMIINTAKADDCILAVYMNGSRVNPEAERDIFQDYDIAFVVKETESFRRDRTWIDRFGDRLYMQYPEENDEFPSDVENCYGWLMQFADGNRLDLHVQTLSYSLQMMEEDRMFRILYDKAGCLAEAPEPTAEQYRVKRPEESQFLFVCNEFWWCLNNAAKGLWRKEVPYAQDIVNLHVRPQLITLLSWKAGIQTNFTCSAGKSGKYLYRSLSKEDWDRLIRTYAGGRLDEMWEAADAMCVLFHETALAVAEQLGFRYDVREAEASLGFFRHVKGLPEDAKEVL